MKIWTCAQYSIARAEVLLSAHALDDPGPDFIDGLPISLIPSVRTNGASDRILAEIDQFGRSFARAAIDQKLFLADRPKRPRVHTEINIVLRQGKVLLQKRMLPRTSDDVTTRALSALGWKFYIEAATLLRLRETPGVPTLRRIDTATRTLELDYVWGADLRIEIENATGATTPDEIDQAFSDAATDPADPLSREIPRLLEFVTSKRVLPEDVHAGNFIRGRKTGTLYMIDFQLAYFWPAPGWNARRKALVRRFTPSVDAKAAEVSGPIS